MVTYGMDTSVICFALTATLQINSGVFCCSHLALLLSCPLRYLHLHYPEVENEEAFPAFLPREALRFPQRCADVLIDTAKSLQVRQTPVLCDA